MQLFVAFVEEDLKLSILPDPPPSTHTKCVCILLGGGCVYCLFLGSDLSRDMRFPKMWHFDMNKLKRSLYSLRLSLETRNGVQSLA